MLDLTKVHDYRRIPDTLDVELIGENHTKRLSERVNEKGEQDVEGTDRSLIVQNGEVYAGEGTSAMKYSEIPEWFWVLARRCSAEGRERVGLVLPEEMAEYEKEQLAQKKYDCPEKDCFASVPWHKKGVHMAQHALKKKRKATKKPAKKRAIKKKTTEQVLEDREDR